MLLFTGRVLRLADDSLARPQIARLLDPQECVPMLDPQRCSLEVHMCGCCLVGGSKVDFPRRLDLAMTLDNTEGKGVLAAQRFPAVYGYIYIYYYHYYVYIYVERESLGQRPSFHHNLAVPDQTIAALGDHFTIFHQSLVAELPSFCFRSAFCFQPQFGERFHLKQRREDSKNLCSLVAQEPHQKRCTTKKPSEQGATLYPRC